jgi:tripartite-type tricarboxylate transporter receptor subunit TctC
MKLPRRTFLHLVAGAAALPAATQIAWAQAYPSRPVRFLVGLPPGSLLDVVARLVAQSLSERLGQPFVVENRPGAGTNLATEAVVRAAPDGYTLLQIGSSNAWNGFLFDKLSFDFIRDIAPVATVYRNGPAVVLVNPSFPATTLAEFITHAKAHPGRINMGSSGSGTPQHLYGELFKTLAGVDLVHVPYRGAMLAQADLIAGQVQALFDTLGNSIEHIRAGRLRAL